MAEININELIKMIESHPDYCKKWNNGVSAEQALYIKFHNVNGAQLESTSFTTKDGSELIIDTDSDGIVYGIEII